MTTALKLEPTAVLRAQLKGIVEAATQERANPSASLQVARIIQLAEDALEEVTTLNRRAAPSAGLREDNVLTPRADGAVTQAAKDVLLERERQQSVEGWTPEHDDEHSNGEMANAAAWYAATELAEGDCPVDLWPWSELWRKRTSRRRDLVKAGALILAEIERLDRAALTLSKERGDQ